MLEVQLVIEAINAGKGGYSSAIGLRRLQTDVIAIAEMLKSEAFRTGFSGKWHLGWVKGSDAGSRGFYSPPSQHRFDTHFATTSAVLFCDKFWAV